MSRNKSSDVPDNDLPVPMIFVYTTQGPPKYCVINGRISFYFLNRSSYLGQIMSFLRKFL